jgi:protein gp37
MAEHSDIEWTGATWPIVQGCDPVSQGCVRCYAVPLLWRMAHNPNPKISGPLQGVTEKHVNASGETILRFTGKIALRHDRLTWPLRWKKPLRIFVPSHGDLFHKDVPDAFIDQVFEVMGACDDQGLGHEFQLLTKRSARQRDYMQSRGPRIAWNKRRIGPDAWPPRNVWFGVSAENQEEANERIPHLLETPAAVRFVSLEPLLGPIDLASSVARGTWGTKLDWAIVGGESGNGARPMHPDWARALRDQCATAGVSFFFKQWGRFAPQHDDPMEPFFASMKEGDPDHVIHKGRCFGRVNGQRPWFMFDLGKKAAGRLLDGRTHDAMPKVTA